MGDGQRSFFCGSRRGGLERRKEEIDRGRRVQRKKIPDGGEIEREADKQETAIKRNDGANAGDAKPEYKWQHTSGG